MSDAPSYEIIDPRFADFVDTDRPPETVAEGCVWTEGPVWLDDGLFFNDIPNKRMLRWTAAGGLAVALADSDFANGNTLDGDGRMLSCEHGGRRVIRRRDPFDSKAVDVLATHFEGQRLNSPNDIVTKSDGSIWFTDPPYGINSDVEGYPAESELDCCYVFRLGVDGALTAVAADFDKPNGLAFSPDETQLYIADSGAIRGASFPGIDYNLPHHIRVFDVVGDRLAGGRVFKTVEPGVPDGFRIDHEGYVWTSALDGVHCVAPDGAPLGKVNLPAHTSNKRFGAAPARTPPHPASPKIPRG